MISKATAVLGVATCLSVAVGLFAPDVICGMRYRMDVGSEETFEVKQVHFEDASHGSVLPALKLLADSDVYYEINGDANLTEDKVASAAIEATRQLADVGFGVSFEGETVHSFAYQCLRVSQGSGMLGIVWGCELMTDDEGSTAYIEVDDSTGKVISCSVTSYRPLMTLEENPVVAPSSEQMRSWMETWGSYWGLDLDVVDDGSLDVDSMGQGSDDGESAAISFYDETGDRLGETDDLQALYGEFPRDLFATAAEDASLGMLVEWRAGMGNDSLYQIWSMMPK